MKVYYSIMATKSYREDNCWEIKEGYYEYNSYNIEEYIYSVILNEYARFHNLNFFVA